MDRKTVVHRTPGHFSVGYTLLYTRREREREMSDCYGLLSYGQGPGQSIRPARVRESFSGDRARERAIKRDGLFASIYTSVTHLRSRIVNRFSAGA